MSAKYPLEAMRIAIASALNDDDEHPDYHFTDQWIRTTALMLEESLTEQGFRVVERAAAPEVERLAPTGLRAIVERVAKHKCLDWPDDCDPYDEDEDMCYVCEARAALGSSFGVTHVVRKSA